MNSFFFLSDIVHRIIYAFGLKSNDENFDSTDYLDPTDIQYNSTLGQSILIFFRNNTNPNLPNLDNTAKQTADRVEGVSLIYFYLCIN
jgi:hypothetical protein